MNPNKKLYKKIISHYENSIEFIEYLMEKGYKVTLKDKTFYKNSKNINLLKDTLNDFVSTELEHGIEPSILKEKNGVYEYISDEDNNHVEVSEFNKIYDDFDLDLSESNCYNKFLKIEIEDESYYVIPYLRNISTGNLFFNEKEQDNYARNYLSRIIKRYIQTDIDDNILGQYILSNIEERRKLEEEYEELKRVDIVAIKEYIDANHSKQKELEEGHKELYKIGLDISKDTFLKYYFEQTGSVIIPVKNNIPLLNDIENIGLDDFKKIAMGSIAYDQAAMLILEESEAFELFKTLIISNVNDSNKLNEIKKPAKFNSTTYITYDYDKKNIKLVTSYDVSDVKDEEKSKRINQNNNKTEIIFDNIEDFFKNGDNYLEVIQNQYFENLHSNIRNFNSVLFGSNDNSEKNKNKRNDFDNLIFAKIIEELKEIENGNFKEKTYLSQNDFEILQKKIKDLGIESVSEEKYYNNHLFRNCYKLLKNNNIYKGYCSEGKIDYNDLINSYVEVYIKDLTVEENFVVNDGVKVNDKDSLIPNRVLNANDNVPKKIKKSITEESNKTLNSDILNHVIRVSEFEKLFDAKNSELRDDIILAYLKSDNEFDTETKRLEELKKFYRKTTYNLDEKNPDDYKKLKTIEREFLTLLNQPVNENQTLSELLYDTNRKNFNKFIQNENNMLEDKLDLVLRNLDRDAIIHAKGDFAEISIIRVDDNNFQLNVKYSIFENKINFQKDKILEYLKTFKDDNLLENLEININKKYSLYNAGDLLKRYHDNDISIIAERNDKNNPYKEEYESAGGYNDVNKYLNRISKGETCIIKKIMDKRNEEEFFLIKTQKTDDGNTIYIQSIRANNNTNFTEVTKDLYNEEKFTITTRAVNLSELKTFLENKTDRNYFITCKDYQYNVNDFLKEDKTAKNTLATIASNSELVDKRKSLMYKINKYIENSKAAIFITGDKDGEPRKMYKFEKNNQGSIDLKVIVFPKELNGVPYTMTFNDMLQYNTTSNGPILNVSDKYKSGNNCFNDLLANEDQIDKIRLLYNSYKDKDKEKERERRELLTQHLSDNFNLLYVGSQNHALNKKYYETNGYTELYELREVDGKKERVKIELDDKAIYEVNTNYGKVMGVKSFENFDNPKDSNDIDESMCKAYNESYMNKFTQMVRANTFDEALTYINTSGLRQDLEKISKNSIADEYILMN